MAVNELPFAFACQYHPSMFSFNRSCALLCSVFSEETVIPYTVSVQPAQHDFRRFKSVSSADQITVRPIGSEMGVSRSKIANG